ncbi:WbqC family protein [Neolewinella litorea]|uniref:WbqC family protein n=1 Tax=Neolewinella litorea TaxID=2562452 RepID=UPI0014561FB4|nr:WbqC family protein [Neolewinella litorea]
MFTSPTAYFPPLSWFLAALSHADWRWEAHENYQKGGWRNRCRIAGPNGPLLLSIPLAGGKHRQMPVREVRVSHHSDWQRQHAQAIRSAYGRAPYFEHYGEPLLETAAQHAVYLFDYNLALTDRILQLLGTSLRVGTTDTFLGADAGAVPNPEAVPPYRQVFEDRHGFQPGLSVLDGLFCLGPELLLLPNDYL